MRAFRYPPAPPRRVLSGRSVATVHSRRRTPPHSHDTMKLRSLLLVTCMLVVPMLAMFSHLIPADVLAAARRNLWASTGGWSTAREAKHPEPQAAAHGPVDTLSRRVGFVPPAAGLQPVATGAHPPPTQPAVIGRLPIGERPSTPAETAAEPPPLVAQMADRTRQARDQQARDQQAIEDQLKTLGAVSIDCQPLPGADRLHSSTCRVPVDATGQLQRVFQATGRDPLSASDALLEQVTAWRQRVALQTPAASGTDANGSRADDRFQ